MTTRDYARIAGILEAATNRGEDIEFLAVDFAVMFAEENRNFDAESFFKLCGIDPKLRIESMKFRADLKLVNNEARRVQATRDRVIRSRNLRRK